MDPLWILVAFINTAIDFIVDRVRFFEGVDERNGSSLKLVVGKLREQTQPKRFGGNRGAVGKEKYLAYR